MSCSRNTEQLNEELPRSPKSQRRIMMYGLTDAQREHVKDIYEKDYEIIDVSQCFTDVLALNASIIFINPHELSNDDFVAIDEVFSADEDTAIVFTDEVNRSFGMTYYVEDDLENSERSWTNMYDIAAEELAYKQAVQYKEKMLEDIDGLISNNSGNLICTRSKIAAIENNGVLYNYITRVIKHLNSLPPKDKVEFRSKINDDLQAILEKYHIS